MYYFNEMAIGENSRKNLPARKRTTVEKVSQILIYNKSKHLHTLFCSSKDDFNFDSFIVLRWIEQSVSVLK